MSDKKKQVRSKGGNSFLTIQTAESQKNDQNLQSSERISGNSEKTSETKITSISKRKRKSEEEKIEEFAGKVTEFLDRIDGLRLIVVAVIQKRYSENLEKIKLLILKGKLSFLRPLLPLIIVVQKINEQWFNGQVTYEEDEEEPEKQVKKPSVPKNISFLDLAEKNIIFTDNRKKPLYSLEQLKDKSGYVASETVITPMIMDNIIRAFAEVAPKARAIPTPESGKYAGIPMSEVMQNISEEDIIEFLVYVRNYPRGYVGKSYRITESFAGWAVSGTPED